MQIQFLKKIYKNSPTFIKVLFASVYGLRLNYWRLFKRSHFLNLLNERSTWDRTDWENWQAKELESILDYAVKKVPYYRELWKKIHESNPELSHKKLINWPILEKDILREHPEKFVSDDFNKESLFHIQTSGTTGKPLSIWFDRESLSWWYALYEHRIKNLNGVSMHNRWANIGGQMVCPVEQSNPPFWVWNFFMKQLYCSSYHIQKNNIKYYAHAFTKYKIEYLLGYVSSIYNIAREANEQGIELPKLKLVITNAEPLFKHQREVISKAFGCPVIQTYSGSECAFGANENFESEMNLWPEAGVLEVVDKADNLLEDGSIGEFIATGFVNRAMPLIRFRTGDSGAFSEVKNNSPFKQLKEITGRTDDLVLTVKGNLVGRLDPVFKANLNIKEAQIIQKELTLIAVKIVPTENYSETDANYIIDGLKERIGEEVEIIIELVKEIPRGANGKFKAVVSNIK